MNRQSCRLLGVLIIFMLLLSGEIPAGAAVAKEKEAAPADVKAGLDNPLAGTQWRLVEFKSMDDAIGSIVPQDPSRFAMRLNADGTVTMRLDCNSAHGSWSVEPSADGKSGRFKFGPLAATRARCHPPNLDEQILRNAGYIRGYLLKEGRLYLSLMADGGIYEWEPLQEQLPFLTEPDADLEAAILKATPDYTREMVKIGGQEARYLYGRIDLNNDGKDEVFAYLLGSIFCGTGGCNLLLFTVGKDGYTLVNNFSISRLPVIVSDERSAGWNNIIRPESGGGAKPSYVKHVYDGKKYVERERLPADTPPKGVRVLTGEFTFQDGIPLKPRN